MSERAFTSPILSYQIQGHFALRISRSNPKRKRKFSRDAIAPVSRRRGCCSSTKKQTVNHALDPAPSVIAGPITFKSRSPVFLRSGAKPFSDVKISSGRGVDRVEGIGSVSEARRACSLFRSRWRRACISLSIFL